MKVTIQYNHDNNSPDGTVDCCAYTFINGEYFCGWANDFAEAEKRLLAKLELLARRPPAPAPKEVEI